MCNIRVSFDQALLTLQCIKPKIIFLTSKTCNGKTYFSNKLKESTGYKIFSIFY